MLWTASCTSQHVSISTSENDKKRLAVETDLSGRLQLVGHFAKLELQQSPCFDTYGSNPEWLLEVVKLKMIRHLTHRL